MIRLIVIAIGLFLLIFGIIGVLTPIPFGIFFILAALLLLIPTSPFALKSLTSLRRRSPRFDGMIHEITGRMPYPYRRILRRTDPAGGVGGIRGIFRD